MTADIADVAGKTFDYVVVGGGTAGLALAVRLSEDPTLSVLVLEAGEANLNNMDILIPGPAQRVKHFGNPQYDWDFKSVPQVHSGNRPFPWNRGKGLGGSSAINFGLWNKPAKEYLDIMPELGNPGWNWERFEKYSKRSEKFIPPDHDLDILTFDPANRGTEGAIVVAYPSVISNLERPFVEAFKNNGIPHLIDTAGGHTNGSSVTLSNIDPISHFRSYSANGYYTPIADTRKNLTVLVSARAVKINTTANADGTFTATGVAFLHDGKEQEAKAAKEVILSAGAVIDPQLLELSGFGDRAVLEKVGIDVKVDLPGVGANVQEHLFSGVTYEITASDIDGREIFTWDTLFKSEQIPEQIRLFPLGQGVLNLNTLSLTFLPLDTICQDAPKIHKSVADTIVAGIKEGKFPSGLSKQYEIHLKLIEQKVPSLEIMLGAGPLQPPAEPGKKQHVTICFGLNCPFSRGTIHVETKDPLVQPVIDPHIFEERYDLDSMVEQVKFNRKLAQTEPMKSILGPEVYPGPDTSTDEQIAKWLQDTVSTTWHTVGSCSMLPREDGGVVDPKLKVYGTTNLRIVDVSVYPMQIGSHTQALAYALAEQAADIIKGII